MKKVACFAIDEDLLELLEKSCTVVVKEMTYSRSKSEIVNEALGLYLKRE